MSNKKPLLNLDYGTGNPAGAPDFRPLNPWGRAMPKTPQRTPVQLQLYQVLVRDLKTNRTTPVFPKMQRELASMLCAKVKEQIASGVERRWADPVVIPI